MPCPRSVRLLQTRILKLFGCGPRNLMSGWFNTTERRVSYFPCWTELAMDVANANVSCLCPQSLPRPTVKVSLFSCSTISTSCTFYQSTIQLVASTWALRTSPRANGRSFLCRRALSCDCGRMIQVSGRTGI